VVDDNGFSRPMQFDATRIEIANGSVSVPDKSDTIAVLVDPANPIPALTLGQLAAVLDCGGRAKPIRTWGELGLTGRWAAMPIHVVSYDLASRTGAWLQNRAMHGDRRMCWDRIAEYADVHALDGTMTPAAARVGAAARGDHAVLAIANPAQAIDGLRLVPLAEGSGRAVLPSAATVMARTYPLTRRAYAFYARKPGAPLDPRIADFLRYALSAEGQALLADDRGYLPLAPADAAAQRAIVESSK
jgi:phosphate transport system substrate-binding protein